MIIHLICAIKLNYSTVTPGDPQRFVVGSILFTIYVTDFRLFLKLFKYTFHANDLQIYIHCASSKISLAIGILNQTIKLLSILSTTNKLSINIYNCKTKAIVLGSP